MKANKIIHTELSGGLFIYLFGLNNKLVLKIKAGRARKSWFTLALTHLFQVLHLNLECEAIQQLSCKLMLPVEFFTVPYALIS